MPPKGGKRGGKGGGRESSWKGGKSEKAVKAKDLCKDSDDSSDEGTPTRSGDLAKVLSTFVSGKKAKSQRSVLCSEKDIEVLRQHHKRQKEEKAVASAAATASSVASAVKEALGPILASLPMIHTPSEASTPTKTKNKTKTTKTKREAKQDDVVVVSESDGETIELVDTPSPKKARAKEKAKSKKQKAIDKAKADREELEQWRMLGKSELLEASEETDDDDSILSQVKKARDDSKSMKRKFVDDSPRKAWHKQSTPYPPPGKLTDDRKSSIGSVSCDFALENPQLVRKAHSPFDAIATEYANMGVNQPPHLISNRPKGINQTPLIEYNCILRSLEGAATLIDKDTFPIPTIDQNDIDLFKPLVDQFMTVMEKAEKAQGQNDGIGATKSQETRLTEGLGDTVGLRKQRGMDISEYVTTVFVWFCYAGVNMKADQFLRVLIQKAYPVKSANKTTYGHCRWNPATWVPGESDLECPVFFGRDIWMDEWHRLRKTQAKRHREYPVDRPTATIMLPSGTCFWGVMGVSEDGTAMLGDD
jgi:hypothetical protein